MITGLRGTLLGSVLALASFAAEAGMIDVSVELDLLQLDFRSEGNGFVPASIDFDDVHLGPNGSDRIVLAIHFVNGQIGFFSDPTTFQSAAFNLILEGSAPFFGLGSPTVTLLGATGDLQSDTLLRLESTFFVSDSRSSFTFSGLRYDYDWSRYLTNELATSFTFGMQFFAPTNGPGDSRIFRVTDPKPVPEPSTFALFFIGLAGLAFARRRKQLT